MTSWKVVHCPKWCGVLGALRFELLRGRVMPHTLPLAFSLPLYPQCISVRKSLRTFHGSERQREALLTWECSFTSLQLKTQLKGKHKNTFVQPGLLFTDVNCAEKRGDLGRTGGCALQGANRSVCAAPLLTHPASLDTTRPKSTFQHKSTLGWLWPIVPRCLIRKDGFESAIVLRGEEGTWAGLRRLSFPLHA